MSKLNELIAELCPNGVEFEQLSKVANMRRGTRVVKKQLSTDGVYPVFQNCLTPMGYYDKYNVKANTSFIICAGAAGEIGFSNIDFWAADDCFYFACNENLINRYLYYFLLTKQNYLYSKVRKASIPRLSRSFIETIQIPVPPLEIQREIVRILDSFTSLTAELQAELQARQKQYEYYRDQLLTFDVHGGGTNKVQWRTLGEIAEISTGSSNTDDAEENGVYPFYVRSQEPLRKNQYEYDEEAIITAGDGVGVGKVFHYVNGKYALHQRAYRIHPNDSDLLGKYLYHYFIAKFPAYIGKQMYQGSVPSIRRPMLNNFKVAVPPLETQNRIVEVLDNFDAICSDLNIGLPAEIEARQKQYEYYRDALLSFGCSHSVNVERERERELNKLRQYVFGYVMMPLSKVAACFRGEYITKKSKKPGNVPVILGGQEPAYFINESNHVGEIVVVARSGASAGFVSYWNEAIFVTDGFGYEADEELMLPKYLFYALKNKEKWLNAMKRGAGVPHVSGENLSSVLLPVPTLKQQKKIVSILDRFETLCNDMTAGLPAEIEARQKQYEYYRDRLLSFPELTR